MANTPFFWSKIAKKYTASPVADEAAYQKKLALTQAVLQPDWDVLEIACGSGNTAIAHAPFVNSVLATDFCAPMMKHGRKRIQSENIQNVEFKQVSIWDIPEDRSYDAVLSLSFLHLIPDWKAAIKKIAALTSPGGIYASNTVTLGDLSVFQRGFGHFMNAMPILPSILVLKRKEIVTELEANGFVIEELYEPDSGTSVFIIARKPG